ncbi:multidrug DMT transporter permease [Rothia sp. RSM386]|uniref:multidrug DMT transporter permease n=1 Tax=Rothia sp. RSM386 TaxID=3030213 RepID=UPI00244B215F|nr:multidrug DMT transporter permease [Rothia sp. RSM386]
MSAVEPSPPFTPNTTYLTKPATPTLVSVAGWVLLAIAVGWLVLIGYTGFVYATTQLSHLSTWRAQSLVDAQAYYPVLFLMVSAVSNVALHGFCTVAYLRGYRWAALVLSVALALGVLASLLIMLAVAALLGTLNGAPSQDVELLLSSASPLYTLVYIAVPYMLVCVVALALVWSRQSRTYMEMRRDWRVRRSEDYLI